MNNRVEMFKPDGDDILIANIARVSYNKDASNYTDEQNERLINYLVQHKHTSVFRHPQLRFRITCPIYVERQLRKHEVGMELGLSPEPNSSLNSISGRYVDFSDSYTTIKEWRKQSKSSKQGSEGLVDRQDICTGIETQAIEFCQRAYQSLIEQGVSKEQARSILPLSLNTTFIWTGSLLSFLHLFDLRLKPDAQQETKEIVQEMLDCLKSAEGKPYKWTLKSFGYEK